MAEQDPEQQSLEAQAETAGKRPQGARSEAQPSEDQTEQSAAEDEDDEDASSPFDHPAFLPVLLWGLALWFGYDGWINQDPDMLEHVAFNRWGFGVLVILGVYFTIQSLREKRAPDPPGPDA